MHLIDARNVNDALPRGLRLLSEQGIRQPSRDGPVIRVPHPVVTTIRRPCERVVFNAARDANPFFHLVEAAQFIAGRALVKDLLPYVTTIGRFSDDGLVFAGGYGPRWRDWFPLDQLSWAVKRLRADSGDRRVVIQMWDAACDPAAADTGAKDVPCNISLMPYVIDGALSLTVVNRSNDMIMGLLGANVVHMSFLLEYLAARLGLKVGQMQTLSNNLHAYERDLPKLTVTEQNAPTLCDHYATGAVAPWPLFTDWGADDLKMLNEKHREPRVDDDYRERILQQDLLIFFDHGWQEALTKARWPFIRRVLAPMAAAHAHYKGVRGEDRYLGALEILGQVAATDWQLAGRQWIERRYHKWLHAADAGAQHDG